MSPRNQAIDPALTDGAPPPQDIDAERAVLAAMMYSADAIGRARELLTPADFYRLPHQKIFDAIIALHTRNEPADCVTVCAELARRDDLGVTGGWAAVAEIRESPGAPENLPAYAEIVRAAAANRRARKLATELHQDIEADPDRAAELLRTRRDRLAALLETAPHAKYDRLVSASLCGSAILEHRFERRTPLIGGGILAAGDLALIFGRAKSGKTWLTLQLALAIARGEPWFGFETTSGPTAVGFLELELLGDAMQERLRALGGEIPENFHLLVRPVFHGAFDLVNKHGAPVHLDELRAWIVAHQLKVVFIDALARATSCEQFDFSPLLLALDHLRADLGVCIILIHHEGKPAKNGREPDDLDMMRGDSRLSGFPQFILRVVKKPGNLYSARFAGVSNGPTPEPIYFTLGDNGVPRQVAAPESVAAGNRGRVAQVVLAAPRPISCAEVAKLTCLSDASARSHLSSLVAEGRIGRAGEGKNTRYVPLTAESAESATSAEGNFMADKEIRQ
jgi:hypothetical protein